LQGPHVGADRAVGGRVGGGMHSAELGDRDPGVGEHEGDGACELVVVRVSSLMREGLRLVRGA
jgi:hypothetical protein